MRTAAGYYYFEPLDAWSLLPALTGVILLAAGRAAWNWAWPAVAFLGFMLPLPFQVDMALALPLRRVATVATTYVLQTLGYPAFAEGNVIVIDDLRLGVIDACSGLGMLVTFFALSTAVAMVIDRPLTDRIVLVASAAPIALVANVVRITATSIAHVSWGEEAGQVIMHDLAGWLMMPMALGLLWLEMKYLDRLLLERQPAGPLPLGPAQSENPPRAPAGADVHRPAAPADGPPGAGSR
jgi:exosortase